MDESNNSEQVKNEEVSTIYKIFQQIYLKAPPILKDLSDSSVAIDYTEFVQKQIDFKKIDRKFKNGEYCSITDAIKDIRTVFLNCYSFYGTISVHTKKSLKIEELLEKKISYLDKNFKSLANVNVTFNLLNMERKLNSKFKYPKDCYDSVLLRSVAHCRPERLRKYHKKLSTTLTTDKDNARILEKNILSWENEVHYNDIFHRYINSMWELPEIGNFVAILFKKLDLDVINQGEIERMFLIPKESTTMGKIMTTLLMPVKKKKFVGQVMPYKVWSEKLSRTVSDWCKVYQAKKKNKVIVMNSLGIHPDFWAIVNEKNPLVEKDYSELSYFMKVWLVKGLCDYVTIKFKTINDIITNCNEKQCTIWKNDLETEEYFFFDSMPDLRIYYYNNPYDEPSLEFLKSVKTDKEIVKAEDNLTMNGFSGGYCTIQKEKCFKLIADSVESLRVFLNELNMKRTSVPEKLISALENFLTKIESEEYNLIVLHNDSKIKIFKDYKSYPDRIQKDKDNILLWQEQGSKSTSQAQSKEIILQKRTRQLERKSYKTDKYSESEEYCSENGDQSISDFSNSEDEWGAINLPKNKVEQLLQTPELAESEKLLRVEDNTPNCSKIKVFDTNKKDKSIKSVELLKTQNKIKCNNNTNTIVNHNHNKRLINSKNIDNVWSNEKVVLIDSDEEENEKPSVSLIPIEQLLQTPKLAESEKLLRVEDNTPNCSKIKVFDTNKKDKSIKSVELLKTQNKIKCNNNTNTIVNHNHNKRLINSKNIDNVWSNERVVLIDSDEEENEKPSVSLIPIEQLLQTPKLAESEKLLRVEDNTPNCSKIKVFDTNKKDKSIKSVELLKTQNKIKCNNNTNTIVNHNHNKRLINSKNIDNVWSNEKVVLIDSDEEENEKPSVGLIPVEIITLDEDMQNDCEIINDDLITSISTCTENKNSKTNEQDKYKQIKSAVVSIEDDDQIIISDDEDDDQIIISDDEDDNQFISTTVTHKSSSSKIKNHCNFKTNLNKSYNSVSVRGRKTLTNYFESQAISTITQNLSREVTIMPVNVHVPKAIEVTMVKTPQKKINSHFNSTKGMSALSNSHLPNNSSIINVECKVFSKSNYYGEVKFYIRLPNGKEHPAPNDLINRYLKEHNNQLPDYWLVPLPEEIAKQYVMY